MGGNAYPPAPSSSYPGAGGYPAPGGYPAAGGYPVTPHPGGAPAYPGGKSYGHEVSSDLRFAEAFFFVPPSLHHYSLRVQSYS